MISSKGSILVIEDDKVLASAIKSFLNHLRYDVILSANGHEGLKEYYHRSFDLILLDIMLPVVNGYKVAREIRKEDCKLPIIFITGRDLKEDRLMGFRLGADDYITKPFSMEELRLRIKAVIRRSSVKHEIMEAKTLYHIGQYTFDYKNHMLISADDRRRLTKKETDLLQLLADSPNTILRRDIALKKVWGRNDYFMGRSMDVYISKLRKMFHDDPNVAIVNIHNTGFMLTVKT